MIKGWLRMTNRLVMMLLLGANLISCGGGGGSDGGSGFVPAAEPKGADISISLTNTAGEGITEINPQQAGAFRIAVTDQGGAPVVQSVVSATTTIGQLVPESGTALTDANGIAVLYVAADGVDGAGTLTAKVMLNDVETEGSISFSVSNFVPVPPRKLGHFDESGNFVEGAIKVTPSGQISAGGTSALTVEVVDEDLNPVSTREIITFTSSCLFGDLAVLDPPNPVSLGAKITVLFTAAGCDGDDLVTATLDSNGAQATGTVSIAPLQGELIAFDAERTTVTMIAIRGTGSASNLPESANIFFSVADAAGSPVPNAKVNFSLLQGVGSSRLACTGLANCQYENSADADAGRSTTDTDISDFNGVVSTRLLAGSVASPVQVLAYIDLNDNDNRDPEEPSTVSKTLVVSTGVPDQNSLTLTVVQPNPYGIGENALFEAEEARIVALIKRDYATSSPLCQSLGYDPELLYSGGLDDDGLCTDITVRLADKFNNPVPDGTAATLTTEFGRIIGSCVTAAGNCSVAWISQNPRFNSTLERFSTPITINENLDASLPNRYKCPSHKVNHGPCPDDIADPVVNPPGAPRGGRSTITVIVNGEESFVDSDGDGFYTGGEQWTNLPEAFTDHNEDGVFTPVQRANCEEPATADDICLAGFEEFYYDFNGNGQYDLNDTPKSAAGSSLPDGLYNGVLCREEDEARGICSRELVHTFASEEIILSPYFDEYYALVVNSSGREASSVSSTNYVLYVSDLYNNPPPVWTQIYFTGTGACSTVAGATLVLPPYDTQPGAFAFPFTVVGDPTAEVDPDVPDGITVRIVLPTGPSFAVTKTLACDVQRIDCDDPQFSPSVYCPG